MIQRIVPCGRIILVCYYGHEGGPEELEAVHRFCRQLPQAQFNVLSYQFINQRNQPPVLFCIERKKHQRTVDYSSVSDVFIFLQRASLIPVGSTDPKIANRDLGTRLKCHCQVTFLHFATAYSLAGNSWSSVPQLI